MDICSTLENLRRKGYSAHYFETAAAAREHLVSSLCGKRIGFGGSVTLDEMGLYEALSENNEVLWHWRCPEGIHADEIRRRAAECDVYISSANALSQAGEIVNIDGAANRVSAILYGHEKVCLICGINKLEADLDAAILRARNVAAPKNAARLGLDTPCVKSGRCHDCKSPQRICRALSVLWGKPMGAQMEIILIGESLGY